MISKETLPTHWNFLPIRAIFYESDKRNGNDTYELLSVTQDKGIIKQSVDSKKDTSNDDKSKYKVVFKGSIAYNKMRMWQGAVGINELEDGIVSPAYVVINPKSKNIDTKYYYYLFKSTYMISQFGKYSYGLVDDMNSLRYEHFRNIYVPIPPLEEQKTIVQKIDKKVQDINNFIEKKKKFIELLKEQKEAIINQAVTKGIDSSVELKDSGIEWLGEIPKHWKVVKFKYLAKIFNGKEQSEVIDNNGEYPIYGSGGIFCYANNYLFNKPSVLLGRKGTIDKPLYVETPFWTVDTMFYTKIFKNVFPKFFYYLAKTIPFDKYKSGSAIPSMTQNDLLYNQFALPLSLEEQKNIVSYIETEFSKIDTIIEKTQKEIELIQEYKTSFISEVVIGK